MTRLKTEDVDYFAGEARCRGHLAFDEALAGPRPGVMVVHEWWGLDDHIAGGRACWRNSAMWRWR